MDLFSLLEKLYKTNQLTREETVELLDGLEVGTAAQSCDSIAIAARMQLYAYATQTRRRYYGTRVFLRGLIEISNRCKQNCLYCGIRADNRTVVRYRLSPEQVLQVCDIGYKLGYRTFVLQGGEDPYYTDELLVPLIRSIRQRYPNVAITLSLGERSEDSYRALREAGADRYLLRHETASPLLYRTLHPGLSFENRVHSLQVLQQLGYQVGAGFMVGLPGQTIVDLADDLQFIWRLQPDMVGIGPFIPHRNTPLARASGGTKDDTLVMVALARLFVPDCLLPATTAMGTVHPRGREMALQAGANVLMPNLTPMEQRSKYELYNNKICLGDDAATCRACLERRVEAAGYTVDLGRGDSPRARCAESK